LELGFSSLRFRKFFDEAWTIKDEIEKKIRALIEGSGFLMFFQFNNEIFGTGEDGRIVFARIKHPNKDEVDGWNKEASFSALNLTRLLDGHGTRSIFAKKDLSKIQVMDAEKTIKILVKYVEKEDIKDIPDTHVPETDDYEPDNFIKTKE